MQRKGRRQRLKRNIQTSKRIEGKTNNQNVIELLSIIPISIKNVNKSRGFTLFLPTGCWRRWASACQDFHSPIWPKSSRTHSSPVDENWGKEWNIHTMQLDRGWFWTKAGSRMGTSTPGGHHPAEFSLDFSGKGNCVLWMTRTQTPCSVSPQTLENIPHGVLPWDSPHSWLHEPDQVQPPSYSPQLLSFPHSPSIFNTGLGGDVFPLVTHGKEVLLSLMIFPQGTLGFFRPKTGRHFWLLFLTLWQSSNEALSSKQVAALIGGGRGVRREGNTLPVRKHHSFNTSI